MPLVATRGAASAQGFGEFAQSAAPNYIEDVFSTWLFTGNGGTQTITNGIDLSTYGGMIWGKQRLPSNQAAWHEIVDTARGFGSTRRLSSNATNAGMTGDVTGVTTSGFTLGNVSGNLNTQDWQSVSWTFRKQPKFFDVVTWTGDGNASKTIPHSLGSVPGCIITKSSSGVNNWQTYHRSLGNTQAVQLNLTNAASTNSGFWNNTSPTSTDFTVGTVENASGQTYVAYLFAHDAGGFGLTGTDNVISCGSFTTNGSGAATVSLGYEPQWIMIKGADSTSGWSMWDTMRGLPVGGADAYLFANSSVAEATFNNVNINATGFDAVGWGSSTTYIYIAIRRGPMKTPTSGTSVFSPVARTGTGATAQITGIGFPPDLAIGKPRTGYAVGTAQFDRLRGTSVYLAPSWTDAEISDTTMVTSFNMDGISLGADTTQRYFNGPSGTYANWLFRRAPGFFDVVCYTGTGSARTVNHNLGVVPEMMIVKNRTLDGNWLVYHVAMGNTKYFRMNTSDAVLTATIWNDTTPTSTVFSLGSGGTENGNTYNYVWYGFASCPGVSKVGSYTGTGALQTINCGFTGGARFVLIKRTDSTGDWFVYDSARGITSGNDPYLLLNSTAAEVTGTNYVDTTSVGFQVTAAAPAGLNANGGTYIFLAIA